MLMGKTCLWASGKDMLKIAEILVEDNLPELNTANNDTKGQKDRTELFGFTEFFIG